jgi:hypothetical protein
MKFHQNPSSGSRFVPRGQTDMKLIVAFRNFANAPKRATGKYYAQNAGSKGLYSYVLVSYQLLVQGRKTNSNSFTKSEYIYMGKQAKIGILISPHPTALQDNKSEYHPPKTIKITATAAEISLQSLKDQQLNVTIWY